MTLDSWCAEFKWESEAQRLGFLAFWKWWREQPFSAYVVPTPELLAVVSFFIQKDHESHEWWADTVALQLGRLEMQIGTLQNRVRELEHGRS